MNFIFDFETIGTNVIHCLPVRCSYLSFDWNRFTENPYAITELLQNIKTVKFDLRRMTTDHEPSFEDLQFWKSYKPELLKSTPKDVVSSTFVDGIMQYLGEANVDRWWCRDKAFDYPIMVRMASVGGRHLLNKGALSHWNGIDVQSWIQGKLDFGVHKEIQVSQHHDKFDKFNSAYSIMLDVLNLQHITQLENGISPNDVDR